MLLAVPTLLLVVLPAGGRGVGVVGSVCVRDASDAAAREEELFPRASWQALGDPGIRRTQKRHDLAARAVLVGAPESALSTMQADFPILGNLSSCWGCLIPSQTTENLHVGF